MAFVVKMSTDINQTNEKNRKKTGKIKDSLAIGNHHICTYIYYYHYGTMAAMMSECSKLIG